MTAAMNFDTFGVGCDIPARPGMDKADLRAPCPIPDPDAQKRNIRKMGDHALAHGMRHRAHGKMHQSVDALKSLQEPGTVITPAPRGAAMTAKLPFSLVQAWVCRI